MTFGQTLKQLMAVSGVKAAHLAQALKYDISYISRWANGQKLPSLRNNDELFESISFFIVSNSSPAALLELGDIYGSAEPAELRLLITAELQKSYRRSSGEQEKAAIATNAAYAIDGQTISDTDCFADAIQRCAEQGSKEVHCITNGTMRDWASYNSKGHGFWETILHHESLRGDVRLIVHQLVDMREFADNVDSFCAAICCYANYGLDMRYEFYICPEDAALPGASMTMIEDKLLFQSTGLPFAESNSLLICTDSAVLKKYYQRLQKKVYTLPKLLTYYLPQEDNNDHFLYDYVMDGDLRYFLNVMHPVYMTDSFAEKVMEKYAPEIKNDEFQGRYHALCAKTKKEVVIYRSAFLEYIYSGNMYMFGKSLNLDKEDRKTHLRQLLENIREGKCSLTIINDTNPLLNRAHIRLSFYLSPNIGFASSNSETEGVMARFRSHRLVDCFNRFFEHFQSLEREYAVSGKDTEDFIERGIAIID